MLCSAPTPTARCCHLIAPQLSPSCDTVRNSGISLELEYPQVELTLDLNILDYQQQGKWAIWIKRKAK